MYFLAPSDTIKSVADETPYPCDSAGYALDYQSLHLMPASLYDDDDAEFLDVTQELS